MANKQVQKNIKLQQFKKLECTQKFNYLFAKKFNNENVK